MKPLNIVSLFATVITLFLLSLLLPQTSASAATSYSLVCRGGGEMYFNYTPYSNISQEPQIWITFQRAAQGVGDSWQNLGILQPGQCSWLDRPVVGDEPDRIVLLKVSDFSISWSKGTVRGISSSLPHINRLQNPGKYQSFMVYNDGKGSFIVTSIGAGKD